MIRFSFLIFLLCLPSFASAESCADALGAAKKLAAAAKAETAEAEKLAEPGAELAAARSWHTVRTRSADATDSLAGAELTTCSAGQQRQVEKMRTQLSADWHAADEKYLLYRDPACTKLIDDTRLEALELAELQGVAERQVYIETGMGFEYKMTWRTSLAKAFSCDDMREIYEHGHNMSREISAFLGTPKSDGCSNSRKIAVARSEDDDPVGFITYAHVALHYAGCDAAALLISDAEFKALYEKYHRFAPAIYGSVYE